MRRPAAGTRRPARGARRLAGAPAAVLLGAVVLAGCGDSGSGSGAAGSGGPAELSVGGAYMPRPVSATMAAGFLTITNTGGTKDELTSVTSPAASSVTLHVTTDSAAMEQVSELTVPAHGRLVFRSGGDHLMFDGMKKRPAEGDKVSVRLHFASSRPVTVEIPVKSATYNPSTGH
ncbi:copper chaperone PCu(A)C [Streptomyces sp. NPDC090306]|uniref:copper chaperone PCu(A)C n=1 Tax=unclassified Streptomyces TaxID=2593676 RepID=UPI0036E8F4AA